jgi:hypothetical protein
MLHGHALAPPRILDSQLQNASVRFLLTLLVLYITSIAWGCAGRSGAPAITSHCSNSVHTKISAEKPTIKVSYTEPSVTVAGSPLNDLAKTTIYYDLGNGRRPALEVPATKPTGGGQISKTIIVPIQTQNEQIVKICTSATDGHGNESAVTP